MSRLACAVVLALSMLTPLAAADPGVPRAVDAATLSSTLPPCPAVSATVVEGRVADDEVDELSGIVSSRRNAGLFWVHNDSGDEARAFAIDLHGRALGELVLSNVRSPVDIEDIALLRGKGKTPDLLYLADIGDNSARRRTVQLYRVEEPKLDLTRPAVELEREAKIIDVVYDDGGHDAETLLADPRTGDLYIVAKARNLLSEDPVGVYRLPAAELARGKVVARKVASIALGATTAGDLAPDGSAIIVRNYWSAMYWPRAEGETIAAALSKEGCRLPVSDIGKQGESLAFTSDGKAYVTVPEGLHAAIMRHPFK